MASSKVTLDKAYYTRYAAVQTKLLNGAKLDSVKSELEALREIIQSQLDAGKTHTGKSKKVYGAINNALGIAKKGKKASTNVLITQDHYTVNVKVRVNGPLVPVAKQIAQRLQNYVQNEDATADFSVTVMGGFKTNSVKRIDSSIHVSCEDSISADGLLSLIAPYIVEMYDEMDPDFDSDMSEFLMEI